MSPLAYLPTAVIATVFVAVIFVSVLIELGERRRGRRRMRKRRCVFRPVVIAGGKAQEPDARGQAAAEDASGMAPLRRPNRR